MSEWWGELTKLNQAFYGAAAFFSVFFIWQLVAALMGLDTDEVDADADVDLDADGGVELDHDGTYDEFEQGAEADAAESTVAFKLLSIRSIITFFTLFTWGTALYLSQGVVTGRAMGLGTIWGLAGAFIIALLIYMMKKLTHTGTKSLRTCVGTTGTVYLEIPEGGVGEVRVTVSGVVSYVKAREKDGKGLKPNVPIRVRRLLGQTMVEIEEDKGGEPKKEEDPKKEEEPKKGDE